MRRYLLVSILVLALAVAGASGAQARRGDGGGGDKGNSCPPPSPGFPNPDPPSCGKKAVAPAVCANTLAEDIFIATRDTAVSGLIQNPDAAGPVSTPVGGAVSGVAGTELGREAGCAVSLTGL